MKFRKPNAKVPGYGIYDYVVFSDGDFVGFVRKRQQYANIRPRAITWTEWIAYDVEHKKLGSWTRRLDAGRELVRQAKGKVVPHPRTGR